MTHIYIINLPTSIERKKNIEKQFKNTNINFSYFNAVNGKENPEHHLFSRYNKEYNIKNRGRELNLGQLGCFASHYLLWEECLKINEPIVVLEDDALINIELFKEFINDSSDFQDTFECIRLFQNKKRKHSSLTIDTFKKFKIARFNKGHRSTTGYFLTPSAAQKFINNCHEWTVPVDIYMDQFWTNHVECFGMIPPCLTNDPKFDSDIGYEKESKNIPTRIKRELFNLKQTINRTIYNISYSLHKEKE